MTKGKGSQNTSEAGSKPAPSTRQSALITNPENRPVLVAKVRDDLEVLRKAGFLVSADTQPLMAGDAKLNAVVVVIVAPLPDKIEYDRVSGYSYNGTPLD